MSPLLESADPFADVLGARRGRDPRDNAIHAQRPSQTAMELWRELHDELIDCQPERSAQLLETHRDVLAERPLLRKLLDSYVTAATVHQFGHARYDIVRLLDRVGVEDRWCARVLRHPSIGTLHLLARADSDQTVCGRGLRSVWDEHGRARVWRPARRGAWAQCARERCHACRRRDMLEAECSEPPALLVMQARPEPQTVHEATLALRARLLAGLASSGALARGDALEEVANAVLTDAYLRQAARAAVAAEELVSVRLGAPVAAGVEDWEALLREANENPACDRDAFAERAASVVS